MSKHTPEPWLLCEAGDSIKHQVPVSSERTSILTIATEGDIAFGAVYSEDDASRIVSCVNACAGMADPSVEIAELKRQRDELLDEFDQIMKFYDVDSVAGLIRAQEDHILRLQESVARKPFTQIIASSPVRGA